MSEKVHGGFTQAKRRFTREDRVVLDGKPATVRGLVETEYGPGYLLKLDEGGYIHVADQFVKGA
jgi:hypothetical protein